MVLLGTNIDVPIAKRTAFNKLLEEELNNYTDEFSRYTAELQISYNVDPCTW